MYVMVVYWRLMSDTHTPKVNEIISGVGKIVSVYNGYVDIEIDEKGGCLFIPIYQLKWNDDKKGWEWH